MPDIRVPRPHIISIIIVIGILRISGAMSGGIITTTTIPVAATPKDSGTAQ